MQFEITLHGNETPEQINRCVAALSAYAGKPSKVGEVNLELRVNSDNAILELEKFKRAVGRLDVLESVGEKLEVELVEAETLAKLEAENPQFGKQPLPAGAQPLPPGAEPTDLPLAPAAAAPSMTAPAAPLVSSVAPPPPPGSVETDKNGLPWDERIHSGNRAKIADGSWRMKRNVAPELVAEVEAQLRGQVPAPNVPVTRAEAPANGAPVPAPSAPPLPPGPPALTFGVVASRIGKAVTAGTLSGNVLSVKLAELGFPDGLHTVNARPDMWQKILDTLGA